MLTLGKFNVRFVQIGDKFLVKFYDNRFMHTEYGQFISSYYAETLLKHSGGLCLEGGNSDVWSLNAAEMEMVHGWLVAQVESAVVQRASESPAFKAEVLNVIS